MNNCILQLQKPEELDKQRRILIAEKKEKLAKEEQEKLAKEQAELKSNKKGWLW